MTVIELSQVLGNFGEFFGAIAVVGTLIFLAIQVRQSKEATEANTRSMDEGRRLALAQAYENRTITLLDNLRDIRGSRYVKQFNPRDDPEDQIRTEVSLRWWANYLDNIHYQYQQGFIDQEYYQSQFQDAVRNFAPRWRAARVNEPRPSFRQEVERILAEAEQS